MRINFPFSMSYEVWYVDPRTGKDVPVKHSFEGEYEVDKIPDPENIRPGYSTFELVGDQKGLWDGGQFEVPNPAFSEVR